jgi:hypothetical protein
MERITADQVLYIKLGSGGGFEKECIEGEINLLKLSYHEVPHLMCMENDWEGVHKFYLEEEKAKLGPATGHQTQIKYFYTEPEKTMWVTFYKSRLWWCFANSEIHYDENTGFKTRHVKGKWSDRDIEGNYLTTSNLSGKLTQVQAYRGTICAVREKKYLLAKINCEVSEERNELEEARRLLKEKLVKQIEELNWKDFEILVDLIFRQSGWKRMGQIGKSTKTIDLELYEPITDKNAVVQIKQKSNLEEFREYEEKFLGMSQYDTFFFVACQPTPNLKSYHPESEVKLYFGEKIAELSISLGLIDWIITKTA